MFALDLKYNFSTFSRKQTMPDCMQVVNYTIFGNTGIKINHHFL